MTEWNKMNQESGTIPGWKGRWNMASRMTIVLMTEVTSKRTNERCSNKFANTRLAAVVGGVWNDKRARQMFLLLRNVFHFGKFLVRLHIPIFLSVGMYGICYVLYEWHVILHIISKQVAEKSSNLSHVSILGSSSIPLPFRTHTKSLWNEGYCAEPS